MCLALPGQIVGIDGVEATIMIGGAARKAGLQLHPEARIGDYVLVKTGLVVELLPKHDAKELIAFFDEMVALLDNASVLEPLDGRH